LADPLSAILTSLGLAVDDRAKRSMLDSEHEHRASEPGRSDPEPTAKSPGMGLARPDLSLDLPHVPANDSAPNVRPPKRTLDPRLHALVDALADLLIADVVRHPPGSE
jgi:hypothetical protein